MRVGFFYGKANQVALVSRSRIEELLGAHPVSNHEFDEALQELNQFQTDLI